MRGKFDPQAVLFIAAIELEGRIRADHPLRAVKRMVDEGLRKMSRRFDAAYAGEGRPSVPPERLTRRSFVTTADGWKSTTWSADSSTPPCVAPSSRDW